MGFRLTEPTVLYSKWQQKLDSEKTELGSLEILTTFFTMVSLDATE